MIWLLSLFVVIFAFVLSMYINLFQNRNAMRIINNIEHVQMFKLSAMPHTPEPIRMRNLVVIFCESGEVGFELNYTKYTLKENGYLVITPLDILSLKEHSHNLEGTVLILPAAVFSPLMRGMKVPMFKHVKFRPITYLKDKYLDLLKQMILMLWQLKEMVEPDEFDKIAGLQISSLAIVQEDYFNKYISNKENSSAPVPRKTELFRIFINKLMESHSLSREVLFYANELGVSSGYLNEICNEVSKYSAKGIIDSVVATRLKYELSYTSKSIQELADEYNFPSQSYFTRYYKRLTGKTPSEFRKERQ